MPTSQSTRTERRVATVDARVLRAAAAAPQFSWEHDWQLLWQDRAWWLRAEGAAGTLPQGQALTVGATAQRIAVQLQANGWRTEVDLLPKEDPMALAVVRTVGPGPSARAAALLAAEGPEDPRPLRPSDLRHLTLCAEAFRCELLWQQDAADPDALRRSVRVAGTGTAPSLTTIVTRTDTTADWLRAGQALVQCRLVSEGLGVAVHLGPHALAGRTTRESVRSLWQLSTWPQVQLSFTTHREADL